jgi:hypothetical protein
MPLRCEPTLHLSAAIMDHRYCGAFREASAGQPKWLGFFLGAVNFRDAKRFSVLLGTQALTQMPDHLVEERRTGRQLALQAGLGGQPISNCVCNKARSSKDRCL